MKTLPLLSLFCAASLFPLSARAQNPRPRPAPSAAEGESARKFWTCQAPGGTFTVDLAKISSVSIHEFLLTGGRVTEVNVATEGSALARYYFLEPITAGAAAAVTGVAKERLEELASTAADRTGTEKVWQKVQKDYPVATHAHTIEYRLNSKEDLKKIHDSARRAWMNNQSATLTVEN